MGTGSRTHAHHMGRRRPTASLVVAGVIAIVAILVVVAVALILGTPTGRGAGASTAAPGPAAGGAGPAAAGSLSLQARPVISEVPPSVAAPGVAGDASDGAAPGSGAGADGNAAPGTPEAAGAGAPAPGDIPTPADASAPAPDASPAPADALPSGDAPNARSLMPVVREATYTRVTLSAVGDNLMNMPVVYAADANAGEMGDGLYDFTPMYAGVADILATHDLNFIDIETILGGDHLGLSGYPSFNSPAVIADQVAASGWNLATTATNHSWDVGFEGIQNSSATWAAHPEVTVTGTFTSPEDRATIRTVERAGMRFAFLAYTDYLNGLVLPDDQSWAIATADPDAMATDVERARSQAGADVVIVAMSWGEENSTVPNDAQRFYAQLLADLGVDLVIGFGPHVIQPVEWVAGLDAGGAPTGHQTLVAYSLGNFLSNQPLAIENVEGCLTCTFERLGDEGAVGITDVVWTPLVNHIDGDWHQIFKLRDYTPELAGAHDSIGLEADPLGYAYQLTQDIIGPSGIPIAA